MTFTVTRLPRRGPRKGETLSQHGRGVAIVPVRDGDLSISASKRRAMVADLDSAIAAAKSQHRADRIAAARDRLLNRVGHSDLAVRF